MLHRCGTKNGGLFRFNEKKIEFPNVKFKRILTKYTLEINEIIT